MKKLYPLFISLLLPFSPFAQDLVVKGQVTVEPDALLHVEGDVDIQSTGTLDIQASGSQHGMVRVKVPEISSPGTWNCDGTTTGGGDVEFAGVDVDYIVSGSNVSFPNLILDFGTPGVGGYIFNKMTLNDNVTVNDSLALTTGRIVTGTNEVYVANSAADAITGSFGTDQSRFIEGTLRREVRTGTDNYYFYPIGGTPGGTGKEGYNPASIDLRTILHIDAVMPSGVTSVSGKFQEEDYIGVINRQYTTSGDCYFTTAQQYLEFYYMVQKYGYWDFQPNDTSLSTGWNYDFYCFPDKAYLNDSNPGLTHLKIIKAPSSAPAPSSSFDWDPYFFDSGNPCNGVNVSGNNFDWFPGEGLAVDQTDSIAAWNLTSFSRFGLGGGTGAGLPIELLYLQAYPVNNTFIQVDWATATEINNMGFEVLRSTDGENFTQIGWQDGAGNSSTTLPYGFPDRNVVPNQLYYYRLNQIDYDGTSELTYIVTAIITEASLFSISEFIPNPSENDSRIEVISSKEKDLNVTVYNTLGQVIMKEDHHVVAGTNTIDFDFNLLADGTYYAIIKADNEFYNRKLILTK